jgi:cyclic pyranopterin phosphate synthase
LDHREILRYEEILRIVNAGIRLGIRKVRVTGGEPLVRKGIYEFLSELSSLNGLTDLSLTTNGMLLKDNLHRIKSSGVKRLNISLDSLKADRFQRITGQNRLHEVWDAVREAIDLGFSPVKINMVALGGINDDEIRDFAALTQSLPLHVRFIEYMPIGKTDIPVTRQLLTPEIKAAIEEMGELIPVESLLLDGPAARYRFKGAPGEIGFISPVSRHFCQTCNRIRLTANGRLRPCLLSDESIDIASPLRNGCDDEALYGIFHEAARKKQERHRLGQQSGSADGIRTCMSSIGG